MRGSTKDQLFDAVFITAMGRFVPALAELMHSEIPIEEYIPVMIERVITAMIEYPQIPAFVLQELNTNPDRLPQVIKRMGIDPNVAMKKMAEEKPDALLEGIDFRQVIISLLSMCIFPFAARPVIREILYEGDDEAFIGAMEERKKLVPLMVRQIMMMKKPMP